MSRAAPRESCGHAAFASLFTCRVCPPRAAGEAKDGWLGNEHGPGSLARFINDDSPNAYGSPFAFVRENDALVNALRPSGRVLVVYYEDLQRCLPAQLERIASFLELKLSDRKRDAIVEAVSFSAMKAGGGMANVLLRKGGIGDWQNHMDAEQ